MRSLKTLYTIPAHTSNVSDVRFFRHHDMYSSKSVDPSGDILMEDTTDTAPTSSSSETEDWHLRAGLYLASAGYDGFVKLWSADDWHMLRTFPTDSGKVMSVDLSANAQLLASGTYTRNFQLFAPEEGPA
jgi:U4/U6 small nuclear ribonucleoprotein PRP4